ncbi:hypothetical protein [Modestobacter sp. SYSU DS0290]
MLLLVVACWVVLAMVVLPVAVALGRAGYRQDQRRAAQQPTARRRTASLLRPEIPAARRVA